MQFHGKEKVGQHRIKVVRSVVDRKDQDRYLMLVPIYLDTTFGVVYDFKSMLRSSIG